MEVSSLLYTPASHKTPDLEGDSVVEYQCDHCERMTVIVLVENEEKVTLPTVEFCPLCGNSIAFPYPKEISMEE